MSRTGVNVGFVVSLIALAVPASAPANKSLSMNVDGSHSFKLAISAHTAEPGFDQSASIFVTKKRDPIEVNDAGYSVYGGGTVSGNKVDVDFGDFGKVDVKFHPTGDSKPGHRPAGCTGNPGKFQKGKFTGTIRFNGEGGYTKASANKAFGQVYTSGSLHCKPPKTFQVAALSTGAGFEPGCQGRAGGGALGRPGHKPLFFANTYATVDGVTVTRLLNMLGQPSQFTYPSNLSSATVNPPTPFSGTGHFTDDGDGDDQRDGAYSGNLKVDLIGAKNVPLAGNCYVATFRHQESFKAKANLLHLDWLAPLRQGLASR